MENQRAPDGYIRTHAHNYFLSLNLSYPFITQQFGYDPDDPNRQPLATHPFWEILEDDVENR